MAWRPSLVGALVVAAALAGWPWSAVVGRDRSSPLRARAGRRLAALTTPVPRPGRSARDLAPAGAVAAGLAVAVVIGGWIGVLVGGAAAFGAHRVLRRLEPAAARAERLRSEAELPLAADLLAAALRSGAPVDWAVRTVGSALGGPLGVRLGTVARALSLGAGPAEGWSHLGPVAGADRVARAAVRTSSSGAALAGALTRLADDLRADRGAATEAAARRAGVLIVLPLGLCFLPAFLLAGLVPVIVAVLGDVL